MVKSKLIDKVAERAQIRHREAAILVETIFESMREALLNDERIELRGFGSFVNRKYSTYKGRNPKTGVSIQVPPRKIPFFKVGRELRKMLDSATPIKSSSEKG